MTGRDPCGAAPGNNVAYFSQSGTSNSPLAYFGG